MDFGLVRKLVNECAAWKTEEITFLGGEPTLYPHIIEAISLCHRNNLRTRIVTNGSDSFHSFIQSLSEQSRRPHVCFSIESSDPLIHDKIRRKGSLAHIEQSIQLCKQRGIEFSGILSISTVNAPTTVGTILACADLGLKYLNVHYVTNRGFAKAAEVVRIDEWLQVCESAKEAANTAGLHLRIEETFQPWKDFSGSCVAKSGQNLMFMPDGRVFQCLLFIDVPDAHSFTWTENGLIQNQSANSESRFLASSKCIDCPAMALVNPGLTAAAAELGMAINCMYLKTEVGAAVARSTVFNE